MRFLQIARGVTRVIAVAFAVLATCTAVDGLQQKYPFPVAFDVIATLCLGWVAWGTWRERPSALGVAAVAMAFIAFLFIGGDNPFVGSMFPKELWTDLVPRDLAKFLSGAVPFVFAALCALRVRRERIDHAAAASRSMVVRVLRHGAALLGCVMLFWFGWFFLLGPISQKTRIHASFEGNDVEELGARVRDFTSKGDRLPADVSAWTPEVPCCEQSLFSASCRLERTRSAWERPGWKALGYAPRQESYRFQYRVLDTPAGARVQARADLDCDGAYSLFEALVPPAPAPEVTSHESRDDLE